MINVFLISCTKSKQRYSCTAEEMYKPSPLYRAALRYAINRVDNKEQQIFILSAKHGLLSMADEISPYEMTLKTMSSHERAEWGQQVFSQISKMFEVKNANFIFLAGNDYTDPLRKHLPYYKEPLKGKSFGRRIKWLQQNAFQSSSNSISHEPETHQVNQIVSGATKPEHNIHTTPKKEDFTEALKELFEKARASGEAILTISSGELHRMVGGYPGKKHNMPGCCDVMRAALNAEGGEVLESPASGKGASLKIMYYL